MSNTWTLATMLYGVRVSNSNLINTKNSTPIIGLYNPINSNTNFVITNCYTITTSDISVAINNCWGVITAGSDITVKNNSNSAINDDTFIIGGSIAKTFDGYSGNSILYSVPMLLRFVQGVIFSGTGVTINQENDTGIICSPGTAVGIYVISVPDAPPTITASITWQEVPIT